MGDYVEGQTDEEIEVQSMKGDEAHEVVQIKKDTIDGDSQQSAENTSNGAHTNKHSILSTSESSFLIRRVGRRRIFGYYQHILTAKSLSLMRVLIGDYTERSRRDNIVLVTSS